jgi:hypothetical protein
MVNGFLGLSSERKAQKEKDRDGGSPFSARQPCVFSKQVGREREPVRLALISHCFCLITFFLYFLSFAFVSWLGTRGVTLTVCTWEAEGSIEIPFTYLTFRGIDLVSPFSPMSFVRHGDTPTKIKSQLLSKTILKWVWALKRFIG